MNAPRNALVGAGACRSGLTPGSPIEDAEDVVDVEVSRARSSIPSNARVEACTSRTPHAVRAQPSTRANDDGDVVDVDARALERARWNAHSAARTLDISRAMFLSSSSRASDDVPIGA
jgi:hypothetical protein